MRAPGGEQREVSGILDQDFVVRIEEHAANHIEGLLRATEDDNVRARDGCIGARSLGGNPIAERGDAFAFTVLQGSPAEFGQDARCRGLYFPGREEFGGGQTASERNHAGLRAAFQDLADGGSAHVRGAVGEPLRPGGRLGGALTVIDNSAHVRRRLLQDGRARQYFVVLTLRAGNCGVALLPEPLRALPHPGVVFRPLAEPAVNDLFVAWQGGHSSVEQGAFLKFCNFLEQNRRS